MKPCVVCGRPAMSELPCWCCEGTGELPFKETAGSASYPEDCPECEGSGKLGYCEKCLAIKESEAMRKVSKNGKRGVIPQPPSDCASPSGGKVGAGGSIMVHQSLVPTVSLLRSHRFGGAHQGDTIVPTARGSAPQRTRCPLAAFTPLLWATCRRASKVLSITITPVGHPGGTPSHQNPPRHTLAQLGPLLDWASYPGLAPGLTWPNGGARLLGGLGLARRRAQVSGATLPGQDLGQMGPQESHRGVSAHRGIPIPSGPQPDTPVWRVW